MVVIITFCNGKGGAGKTSVTILLASALSEAGHDVAVLDTDPQGTATRWLTATDQRQLLANGNKQHDALLIDTPPRLDSQEVISSVRRADLVVLVTSPSPADLFTSRDTVELLNREGARKRSRLLFNQVQPGTILSRETEEMADRIGLPALKNKLQRRQAYQHAVLTGWRGMPWDAREEVLKTALEITGAATSKSKVAK